MPKALLGHPWAWGLGGGGSAGGGARASGPPGQVSGGGV